LGVTPNDFNIIALGKNPIQESAKGATYNS